MFQVGPIQARSGSNNSGHALSFSLSLLYLSGFIPHEGSWHFRGKFNCHSRWKITFSPNIHNVDPREDSTPEGLAWIIYHGGVAVEARNSLVAAPLGVWELGSQGRDGNRLYCVHYAGFEGMPILNIDMCNSRKFEHMYNLPSVYKVSVHCLKWLV